MKGRTVLVGMVMACVMAVGVAPVAAQQDVCIHVDGVEVYQSGNASCDSTEGNQSVAIGDGSEAYTYDGAGNTAVVVGEDGYAQAGLGDNNQIISVGDDNYAAVSYTHLRAHE